MTRASFIAAVFTLLPAAMCGAGTEPKKFYITGLAHTETQNDCTIPTIEVYAADRYGAAIEMLKHATVWTEEEWKDVLATGGSMFGSGECK